MTVVHFVYVVSSSQPDLLNFKKGWMVKLEGTEQVKHFFFLTQNFSSLDRSPLIRRLLPSSGRNIGSCCQLTA